VIKTHYINETHIWDYDTSHAFDMYFKDCKICVLDIETTGLSPGRSHFVIGSLLSLEDGEARLLQYFAESVDEEKKLLTEYVTEAAKYDVLLTYNGKHFDIPFLLSRADKLELDVFDMPYNLDLYLVLNGHSSLRKLLPNLKQKTVENFMGLWPYRTDTISGAESAMLYHQYLYLKENFEDTVECMNVMLLHNKDDVLQLGKLLPILEKTDFHKAMHRMGFPVIFGDQKLFVKNIVFEKNELKVSGTQTGAPIEYVSYGNDMSGCLIRFEQKRQTFEISVPLLKKSGLTIMDLRKLPIDVCEQFLKFPNFESEYLVFRSHNDIKYMEVNFFIKTFLLKVLEVIS